MYFRKTLDNEGAYIGEDNLRYSLAIVRNVRPLEGWTRFESLADCLAAWHLSYTPLPNEHNDESNT